MRKINAWLMKKARNICIDLSEGKNQKKRKPGSADTERLD
jgi:hypothetical protein